MSLLEKLRIEAHKEFGEKFEKANSKGVIEFVRNFTETNEQLLSEMIDESVKLGIDKEQFSIYHLPRFFMESMSEAKYIWMLLLIMEAQERGYQMAYGNLDTLLFDSFLDQFGNVRVEAKSIVRDVLQKNEQQKGLMEDVIDMLTKLKEMGISSISELNNLEENQDADYS